MPKITKTEFPPIPDDYTTDEKSAVMSLDDVLERIITLTNEERARVGLGRVTKAVKLMTACKDYAELMRLRDKLSHRVDGQTIKIRLDKVGYIRRTAFENIAWNMRPDAERVMNQWMNSPGHRKHILMNNIHEIGIGIAGPSAKERFYYCQIFGRLRA